VEQIAVQILTKFLVILAAVLSILLSGLAIALTGNVDALKSEYRTMKASVAAAQASASDAHAQLQAKQQQHAELLSATRNEMSQIRQTRDQLEGQVKRLESETKRLELSEQSYASRIDQFTALIDAQIELGKRRQEELVMLREKSLEQQRREIELADRINDLEGELDVERTTKRSLQEQLADARRDASGGGISSSGFTSLRAPQNFRARVTDVQRDADGQLLISIDAGSSDLLRERMKLSVVRGNSWVASVVLETVDVNESVGRVVLNPNQSAISEGDLVIGAEF
jgi:hypothetical protein